MLNLACDIFSVSASLVKFLVAIKGQVLLSCLRWVGKNQKTKLLNPSHRHVASSCPTDNQDKILTARGQECKVALSLATLTHLEVFAIEEINWIFPGL